MNYIILVVVIVAGFVIGFNIPVVMRKFNNPVRRMRRVMKEWEKDIEKMSDEEISRRMKEFYEWKEAIDDDWR